MRPPPPAKPAVPSYEDGWPHSGVKRNPLASMRLCRHKWKKHNGRGYCCSERRLYCERCSKPGELW